MPWGPMWSMGVAMGVGMQPVGLASSVAPPLAANFPCNYWVTNSSTLSAGLVSFSFIFFHYVLPEFARVLVACSDAILS